MKKIFLLILAVIQLNNLYSQEICGSGLDSYFNDILKNKIYSGHFKNLKEHNLKEIKKEIYRNENDSVPDEIEIELFAANIRTITSKTQSTTSLIEITDKTERHYEVNERGEKNLLTETSIEKSGDTEIIKKKVGKDIVSEYLAEFKNRSLIKYVETPKFGSKIINTLTYKNGNIVERQITINNEKPIIVTKLYYTNNKLTKREEMNHISFMMNGETIFKYNDIGQVIEIVKLKNGTEEGKNIISYFENGLIKEENFSYKSKFRTITKYNYK